MTETRRIILQFPSLRAFLAEYGERVSADGILLRSEVPPAAGSVVDIEVVVAEGMRLLRARGETLWSGAARGGHQAAAVRFTELDDASRTLIGKIVDQRRREGAEPFDLADVPGPREARLRELTEPAAATEGSVFDLAAPEEAPALDLFEPPASGESPAAGREPVPPVPLLADPEPAPFDLAPEAPADEPELAAAGPELESGSAEPEIPAAETDLSDLFGGDEPEIAPASGRTEAFPPSFVDEVEAELEAADAPRESYLELDTSELEVELGAPVESPSEPEPAVETAAPAEPALEESPQEELPAEDEPAEEPPATPSELPPILEGMSPQVARAFAAEHGPETVEIPVMQAPPPPPVDERADEMELEAAPEEPPGEVPPPVVTAPPAATGPAAQKPAALPALDDNLLSMPEQGAEGPAADAAAEPVRPAEPADLPTSAQSLRGAAGRSRHFGTWLLIALLVAALGVAGYFIYGLMQAGGPPEPRQASEEPPSPPAVPQAAAPGEGAGPAEGPVASEPAPSEPAPPEPAAEEPRPSGAGEIAGAEETAPAEPQPAPEPPAPLTGLDRITWSEGDTGTVLALVGDGEISRDAVEMVPIGGASPRLVIKISGVERAFQPAVLEVGTSHVERVRTGLHAGGELHVVVDLAAAGIAVRDLAAQGSRLEVRVGPQ